ncbi:MAG: IS1096 element passenger TnpR family protein [Isosphaeraceae bacterium]
MEPPKLTTAQENVLRDQVISADQPGPVLHDFQVLLDALGPDGFEAGGKYNLIPIKLIGELDRRLSRPLNLELKRPQIRSHPYMQGLNLLLRATGLSRVEGTGAKARLVLDPAMKMQWDQLNPTERYFNLMEAAFRFGRSAMVGERGQTCEGLLSSCLITWEHTPERGRKFNSDKPKDIYLSGISRNWYLLALMDLFGLMAVEQPPRPVTTWHPAALRHVPFGDAVMTLLAAKYLDEFDEAQEDEDEDEEDEETTSRKPCFGAWQPLFQPFFPEWQRNLEFPRPEPREGMFIFRVSLGQVWRLIAMPSDATLDDLAALILRSVKFDSDHLFEFTYRDRLGAECSVFHHEMDEGPWAHEVLVGELPLEPGQTMTFRFDFGDKWQFTVKLERVEPLGAQKRPRVLESHGTAPPQYPAWDE